MDALHADQNSVALDGGPLDGERRQIQETCCWIGIIDFSFPSESRPWGLYVRVARDRFAWRTWTELRGNEVEWARQALAEMSTMSPFRYLHLLDAALSLRDAA